MYLRDIIDLCIYNPLVHIDMCYQPHININSRVLSSSTEVVQYQFDITRNEYVSFGGLRIKVDEAKFKQG